jgi:hypothetical protein
MGSDAHCPSLGPGQGCDHVIGRAQFGDRGRKEGRGRVRNDGAERLDFDGADSIRFWRGFTVDFGDGRVGRVTDVRFGSLSGQPRALIVETGVFRRRRVDVPIVDVASVTPAKRHIVLHYPGIMGLAGQGRNLHLPPVGEAGER